MRSQISGVAVAFIFWKSLYALTIPSYPSLYLPSSLNASTLQASGYPDEYGFSVETLERGYQPMDETAFYMTILAAMYDLSWANQQRPQAEFRTWEVPNYNVRVAVKADQVRFGVYGLLSTAMQGAWKGFWPMILSMTWSGNGVGQINIDYRNGLSSNISDASWSGTNNTLSSISTLSTALVRSADDVGAAKRQYNIKPNGRSIPIGHVFNVTLQALVVSAEAGYKTDFRLLRLVDLGFVFIADFDAEGKSLMDHGDLIGVVTFLAIDMVEKGSFEEVDVKMLRDGVVVGHGNLRGG